MIVYGKSCCPCTFDFLQIKTPSYMYNKCLHYLSRHTTDYGDHYKRAIKMIKQGVCSCITSNLEMYRKKENDKYSLLHLACCLGELDLVEGLLTRGCDLNIQSEYLGMSPLHVTIIQPASPVKSLIITQLLKAGCRTTTTDRLGYNVLHILFGMICSQNHSDCVENFKLLIKSDPNFRSSLYQLGTKESPMHPLHLLFHKLLEVSYVYHEVKKAKKKNKQVLENVNAILTLLNTNGLLEGVLEGILDEQYESETTLLHMAKDVRNLDILATVLVSLKPRELERQEVSDVLIEVVQEGM